MKLGSWFSRASLCLAVATSGCAFDPGVDVETAPDGAVENPSAPDPSAADPSAPDPVTCGNGVIDNQEQCDDSNSVAGDGCTDTCRIEPAHECPTVGSACMPITGLTWGPVTDTSAPDAIGGSTGGSGFFELCDSDEVLVGFDGAEGLDCQVNGVNGVTRLEPRCAVVGFDPQSGDLVLGGQTQLARQGVCNPAGELIPGSLACPAGEVVSELRGGDSSGNNFASALEISCSPIRHTDGTLQLSAPEIVVGTIGSGTIDQQSQCPAGQVAVGVSGSSGQVVDRLRLACASIATSP